ncbi:putative RNA-binding protein [Leishmania infantum JPCM5]|uniref:RNA-binding_protein_-_putative n=2 Tax=Leishmania infantum TaxID=5671 RepID=A0A6L0X5M5_LEIIN|nr:putative RNA-binding protein [Leishmania infantum JPCM5]CAC9477848.1 RNA-binding_protein_-_putative [Leishmania infantum]CAM59748.1 putative RNA-binding protein [Leishmania infantum JPCM5]SUZ40823.1 RNA-binding_protein_-_putative [Leishmania infantum]|eukprot:XP_001464720.1 putative RNA-binding protein [Leishmania infantum JPCM5]
MDGRLVQTSCRTTHFSAVEATLRDWPEVEAVGSFREKKNNKRDITTVFVTFRDEAAAKAARAKLDAIPGIAEAATALSASPEQEKGTTSGSRSKRSQTKKGNAGSDKKSLAAEFLNFESYEDQKQRKAHTRRSNGVPEVTGAETTRRGRGGRGMGRGNNNNSRGAGGSHRGMRGRGGAHLQPPQNFQQPQQYQQHQLHPPPPPPPRLPPFEANVAFIDNVPFGTTNRYLMEHFSAFGRILDVNRLELMVMICFDNPESVQQCIQHMNGTKIHDNVITVSSGTVRIPGSVAIQMGV